MNRKQSPGDFETVWKRRKLHWQEQAAKTLPDDAVLLRLAERARQQAPYQGNVTFPSLPRRKRWLPYAAAASLLVGVAAYGLARHGQPHNGLPVAEEVSVGDQTLRFLCNHGCSVQDVLYAVTDVME